MTITKIFPFVLALLLFSCATAPKPAENSVLTADEVQHRLMRSSNSLHGFSADGSFTVTTPTMNQSAGFELATRGADSVMMNLFGPFGITVGSALFTKSEFIAYNALKNTVYRGSPERQMRMLPFVKEIPFELIMGTLQGIHLFPNIASIDSFTVQTDGSYSFAIVYENGSHDSFFYNGSVNRIIRCNRINAQGTSLWSIRYSYKRNDVGEVLPEQVEVFIPSKESTLLLEYGSFAEGPAAADFTLPYPEDAEVITIE
ncbi:MAG: DUF4292 domain-containing protein [Bacteriovoracaceae bacterium]|nr:DUF4292 domain-containing protein [Bacteroidota bacterium]